MVSKTVKQLTPNLHCPMGWTVKSFGEVCTMRTEKFDPVEGEDTPYVALEHLEQDTGRLLDVGNSSETTSIKAIFKENDILFGKLRPYLRKYWHATFDGVCTTEILPLVPKNQLNNRYAFYVIQQEKFIEYSIRHSFGTKMPRTSWKEVSDFQILVPPLPEQRKIAAILTSVDDAIAATQRIIDQTEVVKRGMMQKLLTQGIGHTTFKQTEIGEIPTEWVVARFVDIFSTVKSGVSRRFESQDIGFAVIRSANINNGLLDLSDLKYWYHVDPQGTDLSKLILDNGDLLINFINSLAQIGKCCIFTKQNRDFIYTTNIFRLKTNEDVLLNRYFYYYTQTDEYQVAIQEITKPAVNQASFTKQDFENLLLPLPPFDEQISIVNRLEGIDRKISVERQCLKQLTVLKQGLMQLLLTGKVRVNADEPSEVSV